MDSPREDGIRHDGAGALAAAATSSDREMQSGIGGAGIDPVCGMTVDYCSRHKADQGWQTHHFCSDGCRAPFEAHPDRFAAPTADGLDTRSPTPSTSANGNVEFTCPMHPEIRQIGPGVCPICGMALGPVTVTADFGPSDELVDMSRRSG